MTDDRILMQALTDNSQAVNKLLQNLKIISANQKLFIQLWEEESADIAELYFKKPALKILNQTALAAEVTNKLWLAGKWILLHSPELPAIALVNATEIDPMRPWSSGIKKIGSITKDFVAFNLDPKNLFWNPIQSVHNFYGGSAVDQFLVDLGVEDSGLTTNDLATAKADFYIKAGGSAIVKAFIAAGKCKFYYDYAKRLTVINQLQTQLVAISAIVRALDNIKIIFAEELGVILAPLELSMQAQDLINELRSATFASKSKLYFEGRVLATYYKIRAFKDHLANLFIQIGELDVVLSNLQAVL